MIDQPLITVIIPCFNAEATIAEAIQSALDQTYENVEVIVIDDGSRDKSLDVIQSFGKKIRWESGPNRGGDAARNHGLALAKGSCIQFLDADDLLKPSKLARQLEVMEQEGATTVFCDGLSLPADGSTPVRIPLQAYDGADILPFVLLERIQTTAPLHRKSHLDAIGGFDETLTCCQELDLNLRLVERGVSFFHLREVLFEVRKQPCSVSSDYIRVLDQAESLLWKSYDAFEKKGLLDDTRRAAFAKLMASCGRDYLMRGSIKGVAFFKHAQAMDKGAGIADFGLPYRMACRTLGPVATERLVNVKRRWKKHVKLWKGS